MRTRWFGSTQMVEPHDSDQFEEVELSHFAAIMGMSAKTYRHVMKQFIESGRLLSLVKFESRGEMEKWLVESGHYDNGDTFGVMFRLSVNKTHDDALFCECKVDTRVDENRILVSGMIPGYADMPPKRFDKTDMFELMLCDLETNPFGADDV